MPSLTISSLTATDLPAAGPAPQNQAPTGSVLDLFAQLKEFSWKGVPLPFVEMTLDVRQDLVIHRYADRNGAYVEGTGRHPVEITARMPFINQIFSGHQENWPQGALYPTQWRLFLAQCLEGTSGVLQHPELEPLNCKIDLARTTWSGAAQGGVWVQATWLESDDTQADQLGQDLSQASPITNVVANADDLDDNIATLAAAVSAQQNPLPPLPFTFDDLANAIVGVIDTTTILQKEFQGRIENIIYQSNRVSDAIEMNPILGPLTWPIKQACERMKDSAYNAANQPAIAGGRPVLTMKLNKDSTASQACLQTGDTIADFVVLNAGLMGSPVIPQGTTVSYFGAAA